MTNEADNVVAAIEGIADIVYDTYCTCEEDCNKCKYLNMSIDECKAHKTAEALYNNGYRNMLNLLHDKVILTKEEFDKLNSYIKSEDEVKAIMKEQLQPMIREVTIQEVDKAKMKAVKEFASSVVTDILNHKHISDNIQNILFHLINDKLNDFLNCIETEDKR